MLFNIKQLRAIVMEKQVFAANFHVISIFIVCLPFFVCSQALTESTSCLIPPSSLGGWWPGNNSPEDVVGNNVSTFNGTYIPGEVMQAFSISGTGTDYVTVDVTSPDPALEPAHITVDAWVKASGSPGNFKYIVDKGASVKNACLGAGTTILAAESNVIAAASYALYTGPTGSIQFYISDGTNIVKAPADPNPIPPADIWDGNWHFVAGTYDGSNVNLYIDGVLVGSTPSSITIAYGFAPTGDDNLYFGNYPNCNQVPSLSFAGGIDEVEIFTRALSQSEIQAIYNAGSFGKCLPPPTVAKQFFPPIIRPLQTSTLTITLSNANTVAVANLTANFVDMLPPGMTVAPTPLASTTCTNGMAVAVAGSNKVTLEPSGIPPIVIPANGSCMITVNVTASAPGNYNNVIPAGTLMTSVGSNALATSTILFVTEPCG